VLFRRLLQEALQDLVEDELTSLIGAAPHERTEARTNQRNGGRAKTLSTPAGDVEPRIPKVKVESFFPSLLECSARSPSVCPGTSIDGTHVSARFRLHDEEPAIVRH